ncbi:BLUF domain-containing protein [Oryzibacter oryziterrae]|uniref:BLUF domain-containing protein n=1 Tax=Oryzibacter oryziterrae TaxID=2766474 RepID=UPI001F2357C1|nr:BLUF domain-containing protein [Oryzibacter oryziterrae]
MSLSRLVFFSRTNIKIGESAGMIRGMLQACSEYSPVSGLTGGLVFNEKFFMQVIEGSRDQVSKQLKILYEDNRHEELTVLSVSEIYRREFEGWAVGYAGRTIDAERLYMRYCPTVDINPTIMSAEALFNFIRDFCALETLYVQRAGIGETRASAPQPQAVMPQRPPQPQRPTDAPQTIKVINTKIPGTA